MSLRLCPNCGREMWSEGGLCGCGQMDGPHVVPFQDQDWRDRAACRAVGPALFFPSQGESEAATEAKAVCATCPVRLDCLEYALAFPEVHGVWGGFGERERARMRRARRGSAA